MTFAARLLAALLLTAVIVGGSAVVRLYQIHNLEVSCRRDGGVVAYLRDPSGRSEGVLTCQLPEVPR